MNKLSLRKTAAIIKKHKRFLITVHTSPEGDAIGSELAFYRLLKKLGKQAFIVNEDPTPREYSFLPDQDKIKVYKPGLEGLNFDCWAVLDCSDLNRTGLVQRLVKASVPIVNIDHHIGNSKFGSANLIDAKASSASELVYDLYKHMRVPLDRDSAILLYTGIMTDTGSFRYSNTTFATHKIASELMRFDFDIRQVYKNIYENIPFIDARLLIKILSEIKLAAGGRIAWVSVPAILLRNNNLSFDLSDHVLSFIRAIKDTQVVALFRENLGPKKEIRLNLRSNGLVDVNKIAKAFGGGGHKTASGCTIAGRLSEVQRKVIRFIENNL